MFGNVKFYWNCWTVTDLRYFPKFCLLLKCKGRRSSGQSLMPWTLKMESSAKENSYWIIYILFWLTATYVCTFIRYIKKHEGKEGKKKFDRGLYFSKASSNLVLERQLLWCWAVHNFTMVWNMKEYCNLFSWGFYLLVLHYIIGNNFIAPLLSQYAAIPYCCTFSAFLSQCAILLQY